MTTNTRFATLITAAVSSLVLVAGAQTAFAGRGGSDSRIENAVASGSSDAIIAELERAERLICGSCIDTVMDLLDHPDYEVREAAAWWFARRPAQKKELTELGIANLQIGDSIKARNAADMLGAFRHPKAVPALMQAMDRPELEPEARAHIVRALGEIAHPAADPALAAAMQDSSAEVRYAAVKAWRHILRQDDADPVVGLIDDPDVRVRRKAATVVGSLRDADGRAALEAQLLSDPDPATRRNAAWALGRIGDAASREALQEAVGDPSSLVRTTAKVALRQLH
jgi:HEAT repeat protein